jgi:phage anti-repressor protein
MIKSETVNFSELVKANTSLSLDVQSKMVNILQTNFTDEESRWYIANLYVYMNYHPTNDYPINLEHVFKMIGFAHKRNAKRTLENNFTEGEDYKVTMLPREHGKFAEDIIMLNVDTFKNLCMLAKTEHGKRIRKYYVKLENIYNQIIQTEMVEQEKQLIEKQKELELTKKQLELKSKLIVKKWFNCEPGDMVYASKW